MNYEFLTIMVTAIIAIGTISTSIITALGGLKKSQIESLNSTIKTLQDANVVSDAKIAELEKHNEDLKIERENSRQLRTKQENELYNSLRNKIEDLSNKMDGCKEGNKSLVEKVDQLTKENIQFKEDIAKLECDNEALRKELEMSTNHRKERDEQIMTLQTDLEKLKEVLKERDRQIEKMVFKIKSLEKTREDNGN